MNDKILVCPSCTTETIHRDNLNLGEQCINCGNLVVDHVNSSRAFIGLAVIAGISFGLHYDLFASITTVLSIIILLMKK